MREKDNGMGRRCWLRTRTTVKRTCVAWPSNTGWGVRRPALGATRHAPFTLSFQTKELPATKRRAFFFLFLLFTPSISTIAANNQMSNKLDRRTIVPQMLGPGSVELPRHVPRRDHPASLRVQRQRNESFEIREGDQENPGRLPSMAHLWAFLFALRRGVSKIPLHA